MNSCQVCHFTCAGSISRSGFVHEGYTNLFYQYVYYLELMVMMMIMIAASIYWKLISYQALWWTICIHYVLRLHYNPERWYCFLQMRWVFLPYFKTFIPGQVGHLHGNRNSYFCYFILANTWAGENMSENKAKGIVLTIRFNCGGLVVGIADIANLYWLNTDWDCS